MQKTDFLESHKRIKKYIHNTPVLTSQLIDKRVGSKLFFKCENFQKAGSFKIRGALNAILSLPKKDQLNGVVTHSSGNFAQALSLAAAKLEIQAFIVMPSSAPQVKKNAVEEYNGQIIECEPTLEARIKAAKKIEQTHGATFIHPSNNKNVILGQGSAGIEMLEEHPDLDLIFCPVGGGGLISGTAIAAHFFGNKCRVVGGEPTAVNDAFRSLESGKIESNITTNTVADGLKTQLGNHTFPIIQEYVQEIICVEENEIIEAMKLIWERLKIISEPSAAVALAALIKNKQAFQNQNIGILISGGNVDLNHLPF